jgi:hypothetical protein
LYRKPGFVASFTARNFIAGVEIPLIDQMKRSKIIGTTGSGKSTAPSGRSSRAPSIGAIARSLRIPMEHISHASTAPIEAI